MTEMKQCPSDEATMEEDEFENMKGGRKEETKRTVTRKGNQMATLKGKEEEKTKFRRVR